ncbi:hypothetical protein CL638_01930 [bacterium]|nr:hypothetical protein [bacterium]
MLPYIVLEKAVGQTPLGCAELWRVAHPQYADVPLAYAGRLDPMASGKLLVLIGAECKKQTEYHGLDKEYEFSVLFGITSDTADVLGRLKSEIQVPRISREELEDIAIKLTGQVSLPYPHFSSKTVQGKPLHTWTLEDRLDEIEIPIVNTTIYELQLESFTTLSRSEIAKTALEKINTIPPVTDKRKALGNDFRRVDVRNDWQSILDNSSLPNHYQIATFKCSATSGTYMRSLSEVIAKKVGTCGLAWNIHRTKMGTYSPEHKTWTKEY